MTTTKIQNSEIADLCVSSLPSRPTAPAAFGGRGYTATQMKEAFDRLPLFLVSRFNSLLDDVGRTGENSLAAAIPTGLAEGYSLADLFAGFADGTLATHLMVSGEPLATKIAEILSLLQSGAGGVPILPDGGKPIDRMEEGGDDDE